MEGACPASSRRVTALATSPASKEDTNGNDPATAMSDVLEIAGDVLRAELRRSPPCSIDLLRVLATACETSHSGKRRCETSTGGCE